MLFIHVWLYKYTNVYLYVYMYIIYKVHVTLQFNFTKQIHTMYMYTPYMI